MKRKLFLLLCMLLTSVGMWAETDVTSSLNNPDFSSGKDGWNGIKDDSGNNKNNYFVLANNTTFNEGSNDKNAEMWIAKGEKLGAGEISQPVSNLAAGVYRLTVKMRSDVKCYLFAEINSGRQQNTSVKAVGVSDQELIFIVPQTSDVTIGFGTDGTSLNTYNWVAVDDFKLYRVGDVGETELTSQIVNWDFTGCSSGSFPGWTINAENGNKQPYGETCVEYWISKASDGSFDYHQTVTGLPSGKYTLSASMWNTTKANGTGTSVNGECGVYGTSNGYTVFKGVTPDSDGANLSTFTTDALTVANGTLRLGVKNNTTMGGQWFGVDWIKLYYDPYISLTATDFTSGSEMAAGQWYKFTVTTAGDYGFDLIDGVVLTTDGNQSLGEANGDALTHTVALTTGTTYYIKSETAQTVTKTASPYTYTIGTAASDKEYIQPGNTVTVSYASMATTNTYASEISTAITGVTLGGEAISVTRTTKGFTFTVPEVTKGANYTLSIPANIIGYDAPSSEKNAAEEIILKVPVATEGTYYLSTVIAGQRKWLNKNGNGYTYAYDQGLPFTLERNEGSVDTYKLKFSEGNYLNDVGSNWQTKIEGSKNNDWKLQAEDGGYKLLLGVNNDCQLFIANTSTGLIEITHSTDDGNIWEFVDPETALKYAIEKAEEHVLGFEAGEYAPYNNTAALTALATAKAATTTDARISAYAALTSATWTANEEDVDAICNGSFTGIARGTQDNVVPGWDGVFRKLITTEDYAALSASKEGRAMFSHDKTYVYGGQTGYTMPLKRNTKYALSFKAAGWENGNIATVSAVVKNPDGSTLKTLNITPEKRISEDESLVSRRVEFTTETSGNYTLEVTVPASTLAVITDFSIERLGIPVLMQVSGVAKMGTFCAPFNVEIPSGVKAYTLSDGTNDDWVHMNEVEGTTIVAGTPVLLTSDTKYENEFVGQMTVLEPNNTGLLKGVFEKTEVAPGGNYILQYQDSKCAFYIVSDAGIYIGKNRCYLHVEKSSARIAIDREEGGSTAINEVKSVEAEARTMKDGKYFVKGRIIVVKNGKAYGTNGQILN